MIAGQGTVGLEILQQAPRDLGAIFVPIGGGGLAAGVAAVVKALRPEVRVDRRRARRLRRDAPLARRRTSASCSTTSASSPTASRSRQVGEHTFALCRRYLDGCSPSSIDEICAAIRTSSRTRAPCSSRRARSALAGLKRARRAGRAAARRAGRDRVGRQHELRPPRLRRRARRASASIARRILAVTHPGAPGRVPRVLRGARRSAASPSSTTAWRRAPRRTSSSGVEVAGRDEARAIAADARGARLRRAST